MMRKKTGKPTGKSAGTIDKTLLKELFNGTCRDPHAILGMHDEAKGKKGIVVRVYDNDAAEVNCITDFGTFPMTKIFPEGLFEVHFPTRKKHFDYTLERKYAKSTFVSKDPYHFMPEIGEMDLYLFNQGRHHRIFDIMGAHVRHPGGVDGVSFTVWAPNAAAVSVVGAFNNWDTRRHPMRLMGSSGIWELFIPGCGPGDLYRFAVRTQSGDLLIKTDPYAQRTEKRPGNASIVPDDTPFPWTDGEWLSTRAKTNIQERPVNIYEVHLASWSGPGLPKRQGKEDFANYRDIAVALCRYVKQMGYTHIELLPICEHPLDQSWGYQVSGFYSPTARYGTPEDFKFFMNHMHENGIGVILDWVPAHFPKDAFCFGRFDGTALYEHMDPRQGEQRDWGTYVFNYGRAEVRTFLLGSALYWLGEFHADGLRVDAVASMLYLDYSREQGQWIPNKYGGNVNLEAVEFLKELNQLTHGTYPGIMMVAEESTIWQGVSKPVYDGGLGFTFKWNMGWMHDSLDYFEFDPLFRCGQHNKLTYTINYAFSENFILPLSHDEVVHGKRSIIGRMPGDYEQKFANYRAFYVWAATHPGKKLNFMGNEFAQMIEWNCEQGLDWLLLDYPKHRQTLAFSAELNALYQANPALWEADFRHDGFLWIDGANCRQSVVAYARFNRDRSEQLLIVLNLTPQVHDHFRIGVPSGGTWVEVFNSDCERFGGTNLLNVNEYHAEGIPAHGQGQSIELDHLPWLSGIILKRK